MAKRAYGTHLYVIAAGQTAGDLCKIGRSMNVERRLKEIQHSSPWNDCRLVAVFQDNGFLEPCVLRALGAHERRGEWFRCTIGDAMAAVSACLV